MQMSLNRVHQNKISSPWRTLNESVVFPISKRFLSLLSIIPTLSISSHSHLDPNHPPSRALSMGHSPLSDWETKRSEGVHWCNEQIGPATGEWSHEISDDKCRMGVFTSPLFSSPFSSSPSCIDQSILFFTSALLLIYSIPSHVLFWQCHSDSLLSSSLFIPSGFTLMRGCKTVGESLSLSIHTDFILSEGHISSFLEWENGRKGAIWRTSRVFDLQLLISLASFDK